MLKIHAKKSGEVTILCLQGRIVAGEATALRDAVLSRSDTSILVLDLARVTGIGAPRADAGKGNQVQAQKRYETSTTSIRNHALEFCFRDLFRRRRSI